MDSVEGDESQVLRHTSIRDGRTERAVGYSRVLTWTSSGESRLRRIRLTNWSGKLLYLR